MPQCLADQITAALNARSALLTRQNLLSNPGQYRLLFGKAKDCLMRLEVEPPSTEVGMGWLKQKEEPKCLPEI